MASSLTVDGDMLWVSWDNHGLALWDIHKPASPVYVAQTDTTVFTNVSSLSPYGQSKLVLVSDVVKGLVVVKHNYVVPTSSSNNNNSFLSVVRTSVN
jgi:hypothetical protein